MTVRLALTQPRRPSIGGLGRGMRYVMQIGKEDEETMGVSLAVTNNALISVYNPVAFGGWRNISASEAADYVRRMIG